MFRLRQMVDRFAHLAEVAVTVEAAAGDEVTVSNEAFDWRRDVYGPRAVVRGPGDESLVAEAVEGVQYVLGHVPARGGGRRVQVTKIWVSPVDTWVGDVKVAAALAVCEALGVELEPAPRLGADGPVFPD